MTDRDLQEALLNEPGVHEALQPTTDDGEGDAPLMPARPTPKPQPTLGSGGRELPTQADDRVLVGAP